MRDAGFEYRIGSFAAAIEPVGERRHLALDQRRLWRFVVDALAADRPRDNLHGPGLVVTPCADGDPGHAAASRREQGRVPSEQAIGGKRLVVVSGGVEHHLDNALDVAVSRRQRSDVDPEPTGNR